MPPQVFREKPRGLGRVAAGAKLAAINS